MSGTTIFLCGDVMTGARLPYPSDPVPGELWGDAELERVVTIPAEAIRFR